MVASRTICIIAIPKPEKKKKPPSRPRKISYVRAFHFSWMKMNIAAPSHDLETFTNGKFRVNGHLSTSVWNRWDQEKTWSASQLEYRVKQRPARRISPGFYWRPVDTKQIHKRWAVQYTTRPMQFYSSSLNNRSHRGDTSGLFAFMFIAQSFFCAVPAIEHFISIHVHIHGWKFEYMCTNPHASPQWCGGWPYSDFQQVQILFSQD